MSGILRLESLTRGNTLKQGDKTPLKYRLFDADGEKLNIAGKLAKVRLVYPDFLTIGYEKDGLTVAQDDTVTFTIDNVIPSRAYHVEIIVDDKFIFPSRADESKFTVDKSSLGTDANIIEVIGKDAIVRDVMAKEEIQNVLDSKQIAEEAKIISETANKNVRDVEARQTQVEQFNNQVVTEMTDKDVISAPEIISARGGFDTLDGRLNETDEQFEQAIGNLDTFRLDEFSLMGKIRTEFYEREINIKWFMNESKTDLEAFNEACSFLRESGGGTLYIPNGRYYVHNLEIPSNVKVVGQSNEGTIIDVTQPAGGYEHGFLIRSQKNVTIENIKFENVLGLYNQFNRYAIECAGENDNIAINRCNFYNVSGGVFLGYKDVDGVYYPSKNGIISECYFDTITNTHAIMVMQCDNVIVSNNRFKNIESIGVRLAGAKDCIVEKNYIHTARVGISVQAYGDGDSVGRNSERAVVDQNNVKNCTSSYIEIFNESHYATIRNNVLLSHINHTTRQYGINITTGSSVAVPMNHVTLEGNIITGMNTGIRILGGHKFVYVENNTISDLKMFGVNDIPLCIDIGGDNKDPDISILNNKLIDIETTLSIGIRADFMESKVKIFGNTITLTEASKPLSWSQANMITSYVAGDVSVDTNIITNVG